MGVIVDLHLSLLCQVQLLNSELKAEKLISNHVFRQAGHCLENQHGRPRPASDEPASEDLSAARRHPLQHREGHQHRGSQPGLPTQLSRLQQLVSQTFP